MRSRIFLGILSIGLVIGGGLLFWLNTLKLPDFQTLDSRLVAESTKIYDRTGEVLLYNAGGEIRRRLIPGEEISRHLKNATVAIEDDEFYEHNGFKPGAFLRAVFVNLTANDLKKQGGSTITQQLIKNSLLTQEKKITRKLKEIFLALKLEQVMSKEEILGLYLNELPYGGLIYGVEEAAQTFFGHSAREVSLAEAVYLAAIPNAPTYYSPYGNHREDLENRKNLVLERMVTLQFINQAEYETAKETEVEFHPLSESEIKAPHFVMWVLGDLEQEYGRQEIQNRGFKVITTLDWPLQLLAEEAVATYAESNAQSFNANNAGLVAIDPKTGQVLAMVGSHDYFDQANEGNFNITLAHRQPGSAFKPFVYATAFDRGFTPETMLFDLPTQFDTACVSDASRCYTPVNYDNRFRGPISLRNALAQSINIPSIKILYLAGLTDSIQTAQRMGIRGLESAARYGLTLVLGGGEVSLLDITSAYGVFANDGLRSPVEKILRVENNTGLVLKQFVERSQRALAANTTRLISDILSDDVARAPTFGANSTLNFPGQSVAVKTGTTNDYRDAWIVGYTPNLVAGAWAGNNDNSPMEKKIAGLIITPLWRHFFEAAIKTRPVEKFAPAKPTETELPPVLRGIWDGGKSYYLDKISGKLATQYTPADLKQEKVVKQVHSILYWLNRQNDPQFNLWEAPIRRWVAEKGIIEETEAVIPQVIDDVHGPEWAPRVNVVAQPAQNTYTADTRIIIEPQVLSSRFPVVRADFFLNNNFLGSNQQAPFNFVLIPQETEEEVKSDNELRVVVYDSVGNQTAAEMTIKISD